MKFKLIAVLVVCLLVGMGLFVLTAPPSVAPVTLPSPNGYDALVQAADQVSMVPPDFYESTDVEALSECVNQNQASLESIDQALEQDYLIAPAALANLEKMTEDVSRFRSLSRVLVVKARVAEMEGRFDDAADALAKIILLGDRIDEGGLLIHTLTAVAIESSGHQDLATLAPKLTPEKRAELLGTLEPIFTASRNTDDELAEIMVREKEQATNRLGRLTAFFASFQGDAAIEPAMQSARTAMERIQTERATLMESLGSEE